MDILYFLIGVASSIAMFCFGAWFERTRARDQLDMYEHIWPYACYVAEAKLASKHVDPSE